MAKRYYRILDDIHFPKRWYLDEPCSDDINISAYDFTVGCFYTELPNITIKITPGVPLDFTLAAFDVPVVSKRIAESVLSAAHNDVQMIPVNILDHNGTVQYFILNAIHIIPCLHEGKSKFQKWSRKDNREDKEGAYRMVTDLIVDVDRISNIDIFRIQGWDVPLIVSEIIKDVLEEQDCIGAIFEAVS